jgi:enoyl-CoA hydratase/carnithine racemase
VIDLTYQEDGRIAVVLLDAGPVNVLTSPLLLELADVLDEIDSGEARVIVIGSAIDGVFASGGDVDLVSRTDSAGFVAYMHAMREAVARLDGLSVPSIAAIDGAAFGGGLELTFACTIRVAAETSQLGLPQVKLGTIPAAGGTQRLPRMIGHGRALDLLVTGRTVSIEEAFGMGLVDRCAPAGAGLEVALQLAREIAAASAPAVSAVRRAAEASIDHSFPEGMAVEAREALQLFERGEAREGFAAFLDNRPPNFA